METTIRKPLQGVWNILRFNWTTYAMSTCVLLIMVFLKKFIPGSYVLVYTAIIILATSSIVLSLLVSFYIYDYSQLYSFRFLPFVQNPADKTMLNINAGFDETSRILMEKYPKAIWHVYDFYDPLQHTEPSIKRARKAIEPLKETIIINTTAIPGNENSVDFIYLIFAAHEIRNFDERNLFFKQLAKLLKKDGKIILVEHQRDWLNFLAFNIGFLHFYTHRNWIQVFHSSGLVVESEQKITPFITSFSLIKNGNSA